MGVSQMKVSLPFVRFIYRIINTDRGDALSRRRQLSAINQKANLMLTRAKRDFGHTLKQLTL